MRVYQSPDRRFYTTYSGFGSLYFVWDEKSALPFPVSFASGLPAAIKECDRVFRQSL